MKLRISPVVLDEIGNAIGDALARKAGQVPIANDKTYIKIGEAAGASSSSGNGLFIEADEDDVCELESRMRYVVDFVIPTNLDQVSNQDDRVYWRTLSRSARGLIEQINRGGL